jgi:predicted hydrolase (HD superfamily)
MGQVDWARNLARSLLEPQLPRRWSHSQGVAAQARTLRPIIGADADLLVAAAWLHDIGYSSRVANTEFHPLDGARYLRDVHHAAPRLCGLVAYHTYAVFEAEERDLVDELRQEFVHRDSDTKLHTGLIYADMTTGPTGDLVALEDRLKEIFQRYGASHPVSRSISRAEPCIVEAVRDIQLQLDGVDTTTCR